MLSCFAEIQNESISDNSAYSVPVSWAHKQCVPGKGLMFGCQAGQYAFPCKMEMSLIFSY